MRQLIKEILKEETSLKKKLGDVVEKMGLIKAIKSVGGFDNFIKTVITSFSQLGITKSS
jgi:hypothetical protein